MNVDRGRAEGREEGRKEEGLIDVFMYVCVIIKIKVEDFLLYRSPLL